MNTICNEKMYSIHFYKKTYKMLSDSKNPIIIGIIIIKNNDNFIISFIYKCIYFQISYLPSSSECCLLWNHKILVIFSDRWQQLLACTILSANIPPDNGVL